MSQAVKLDVFYPYPPERVWQVLTDRRALAAWMMENDFEPKLGHKFRFHSQPLLGVTTTIHCEVMELEEPTRLVYTWQESPTTEPSLVVWSLTPVTGGTQLSLKHHQYSYTIAIGTSNRPGTIACTHKGSGLFGAKLSSSASGSEISSGQSPVQSRTPFNASGIATIKVPDHQPFAWDYYLEQRLPIALAQDESTYR